MTAQPVRKNERLSVAIEDLTHDGNGVAKVDGYPLFIPNALPGETLDVHVVKTLKSYGFAKALELREPSPDRTAPPCPVFWTCGGCQIQHMNYGAQLAYKHRVVESALRRLGGIEAPVLPVIGMEDPWHYRNKSQIPFGMADNRRVIAGFYRPRSHDITDTDTCLIQTAEADRLLRELKAQALSLGLQPYDEATRKGVLRHAVIRKAFQTGESMVVLVTATRKLHEPEAVIKAIRAIVPSVASIQHNVNPDQTNVIFGAETKPLWGKPAIEDAIGDVRFEISARSFYQINPIQTEKLYRTALEFAQLTGEETVIDAYCGIGTISLFLARQAKRVLGVEIVPEAIEDAKRNAALNGIANARFEAGPAEVVIPAWYAEGLKADVLVVDPPRKGCDPALLSTILEQRPARVVYVSCNPATLARDLRILEDGGYKTERVQPVDMFPQTVHVECISQLVLKKD